jgi:hypothetical protein
MIADLYLFCSEMSDRNLRLPHGVLPPSTDSQCGRAVNEFLQVCQMYEGVAGELMSRNIRVGIWRVIYVGRPGV